MVIVYKHAYDASLLTIIFRQVGRPMSIPPRRCDTISATWNNTPPDTVYISEAGERSARMRSRAESQSSSGVGAGRTGD